MVGGDTRVEDSKSSLGFSRDESITVVLVPFVEGLLLEDIFDVFNKAFVDVFKLAVVRLHGSIEVEVVSVFPEECLLSLRNDEIAPLTGAPFILGTIIVFA